MEEPSPFEVVYQVKWLAVEDKEIFFKTKKGGSRTIPPEVLDKTIRGRQDETLLKNFSLGE